MKIKRLRLAGFGPYKDEQRVDFEQFDDDGIFLITGKTGAGKSSILDAICFALYASVPRYDGRESQLRSDHAALADPTFVELEFSVGGHDYRLYRTPAYLRPKRGRDGTTLAAPEARLWVRDAAGLSDSGAPDGWRGLAAKPVEVGRYMAEILPLRADQFLQVILLAQNRFQQFLLAKTDERRALLRTLFGTARFEAFEKSLADQNRALTAQVRDALQSIRLRADQAARLVEQQPAAADTSAAEHDAAATSAAERPDADEPAPASPTAVPPVPTDLQLDWFHTVAGALTERQSQAAGRADAAETAFTAADLAHATRRDVLRRQQKRDAAAATLDALLAETPAVDLLRRSLAEANRAAQVWPQIEARRAAERGLHTALEAERSAREAWQPHAQTLAAELPAADPTPAEPDAAADPMPTPAALRVTVEHLVSRRGVLDRALTDEQRIPALERQLATLTARRAEAGAELAVVESRLRAIPGDLERLTADLAEAQVLAAGLPAAHEERRRLTDASAAASRAATAEADLTVALHAQKAASTANLDAAFAVDRLLAQRLAGHAFELAAGLSAGEPCTVCGSTEHPRPATSDVEPVTEDDTDRAQQRRSSCQQRLRAADDDVARLQLVLAEARVQAGGRSPLQLEAETMATEQAVTAAERANATCSRLETQRHELTEERDGAEQRLRDLRIELEDAQGAFTAAETSRALIALRVLELRGGFSSVAERVRSIDSALAATRSLEEALAASARQRERLDQACATETAQLGDLRFADAADAEQARLAPREAATREEQVRRHDDGLAAARGVLADPDLAALPHGLVDLASTEAALDRAVAARDEAVAVRSTLTARLEQLTALVGEAAQLFRASAGLIEQHAHVRELAELVAGTGSNTKRMRLETYVLAAQLEQIIEAANARLGTMTGSRYSLELDDSLQYRNVESGLGLSIRDEHTGRARPTHSLSGGETFLASLALALGLAEVVSNQTGGIALDTLFVDEGFGTLDAETLEIAMSTLDGLRTGGRTIGLISHVDSMKEQITAKLRISVTAAGYSEIEEVRERV